MSISAFDKPRVLILSLGTNSSFNQFYQSTLGKLNTRAAIDYATSPDSVLQTLAVQRPQAVLVTDGSVTQHRNVYAKLLDYVHGGGILVLMGDFSSSIRPDDLDKKVVYHGLQCGKVQRGRTARVNRIPTNRFSRQVYGLRILTSRRVLSFPMYLCRRIRIDITMNRCAFMLKLCHTTLD